MIQNLLSEHWNDKDGNPEGGVSSCTGMAISWQHGPLGRDENRKEPNGAFVETIILAAKKRLEFYQNSRFMCAENAQAIRDLDNALQVLDSRTKSREKREVEGTHAA